MNKKIQEKLQDAVKDFGLSKDAITSLIENASKGVADDASDEDVAKIVETYTQIAKITQGEVTRKVQQAKTPKKTDPDPNGGDGDGGDDGKKNEPEWFKAYREEQEKRLKSLEDENTQLKNEKSKQERSELIAATAKKLGIPEYLMKRVTFADDADIEKELGDYKQDLVNNSLLPKDSGGSRATEEKQMQEDAEAWAKNLPDVNGGN